MLWGCLLGEYLCYFVVDTGARGVSKSHRACALMNLPASNGERSNPKTQHTRTVQSHNRGQVPVRGTSCCERVIGAPNREDF